MLWIECIRPKVKLANGFSIEVLVDVGTSNMKYASYGFNMA